MDDSKKVEIIEHIFSTVDASDLKEFIDIGASDHEIEDFLKRAEINLIGEIESIGSEI